MAEATNNPSDIQNLILQMTQVAKKHETKDYVGLCVVCTKGVDRNEMVYKNNRIFHSSCFEQHGNEFPSVDPEESQVTARNKIELAELRNLKVRTEGKNPSSSNPPRKKSTRRKTKRRTKRRTKKRSKRRTKRKKTRRRTAVRRKTRRRPRRRPSRRVKRRVKRRRPQRKRARRRR